MTAPALAFADYTKPFLLEMDASKGRLGAVLSQKQVDGRYHPVAYGSRTFTLHEKNNHLTTFEFLVLKWAVTEHFKEYLPVMFCCTLYDDKHLMYFEYMSLLLV